MRNAPTSHRKIRSLIACAWPLMIFFQLLSMNAMAQTSSRLISLLAGRVSARSIAAKVAFTHGPKYPTVGQAVQFRDTSTGSPISWAWDFGDGETSAAKNPSHIFSTPGFRKVTLIATNNAGSKKSVKSIMIMPDAAASFVFSPMIPGPGQTVQFADTSSGDPTSWQWDFGDGGGSTTKNPGHVFLKAGFYTITLISSNSSGSKQASKTVTVASASALSLSFNYSPVLPSAGQAVQFTDTSAGTPTSWQWNFGDGGTSTSQNPSHSYTTAGLKTVTLTATTASGSNSTTRTVTVTAAQAASFTYSPASPAPGQAIQFTDTSAGSPTSWYWDFNDGSTSSAQNPSHAFSSSGPYNVTLVMSNAYGSDSISENITVDSSVGAYWVSPTGAATWANAKSATPLSGASCCSLSTANANASAGDIVYLRAGTYRSPLAPTHSGTSGAKIIWSNYNSEYVLISNNAIFDGYYYYNILLWTVSWNVFDGINIKGDYTGPSANGDNVMILSVYYNSNYNEFKNMDIDGNGGGRLQWRSDAKARPCLHNWMHNCTVHNIGYMYFGSNHEVDQTIGMMVEDGNDYTTVEDCDFHHNGHANLELCGRFSVVKNNFMHNEGWLTNDTGHTPASYLPDTVPPAAAANLWGHRDYCISSWRGEYPAFYQLVEGNRFGTVGPPAENGGGENLTIVGPSNIIRYNEMFNAINNAVLFKQGGSGQYYADYNTFYNNTIYKAGRYDNHLAPDGIWQGYGIFAPYWTGHYVRVGNAIINNIINSTGGSTEIAMDPAVNTIANNFLAASGNPLFVNTNVTDPTSLTAPDLSLQAGSLCINAGTKLTLAVGSGSGSSTLTVANARFFQDGTWGAIMARGVTLFPDWIAIGTVGNAVQISSINYDTNTITLASPMTWTNDAPIWLYKNSSGKRVLYGAAPDIGAHEFDQY